MPWNSESSAGRASGDAAVSSSIKSGVRRGGGGVDGGRIRLGLTESVKPLFPFVGVISRNNHLGPSHSRQQYGSLSCLLGDEVKVCFVCDVEPMARNEPVSPGATGLLASLSDPADSRLLARRASGPSAVKRKLRDNLCRAVEQDRVDYSVSV